MMAIVWDKLFGTFEHEREKPVYGVTDPIKSWNPAWANFHYWKSLWGHRIRVWFGGPETLESKIRKESEDWATSKKATQYDPKYDKRSFRFAISLFVFGMGFGLAALGMAKTSENFSLRIVLSGLTLFCLVGASRCLEPEKLRTI